MLTGRPEWLRLLVLVPAFASVALGAAALVIHMRAGQLSAEPSLISPLFAIVLVLSGVLLTLARYRRSLTLSAGFAALVILSMALGTSWVAGWNLGGRTAVVVIASILVWLGGLAALRLGSTHAVPGVNERSSTAVVVVGVLFSVAVSVTMIERDRLLVDRYAFAAAEDAATKVADSMENALALIQRMGERWSVMDHEIPERFLEREIASYLRDFPTIGKISVMTVDGRTVLHRTRLGYGAEWQWEQPDIGALVHWLAEVASSKDASLSPFLQERSDGVWGTIAVSAGKLEELPRIIVVQLNLSSVLERTLESAEGVASFKVSAPEQALYETERAGSRISAVVHYPLAVQQKMHWQMSSYLTSQAYGPGRAAMEALPEIYLLAGLAFTLLIGASIRFSHIAWQRSHDLRQSSLTDGLTQLPNRVGMVAHLNEAIAKAQRNGESLGVLCIGLENLDLINDSLGHQVGDALIVEVARRLQHYSSEAGSVARHGDYDFLILHENTNSANMEVFVRGLIANLQRPYGVSGHTLRVAAHAGYTLSNGRETDPMQLLREADLAMLDARRAKLRSWHAYSAQLNVDASERLALLNDLQHAIESEALALHYQPVVEGGSGRVVAVEALLRWNHPKRGAVPPNLILPLAEETGIIIPLTDWVLRAACRDSRRMREEGLPSFPICVNISPRYFHLEDFVARIQEVLVSESLESASLELEITEGVMLENQGDAIRKLEALRAAGVGTSLDDFGTGYSSLSYLKTLPVDKVKIDKTFITDILSDKSSAAIVRGIISMVRQLDIKLVAEGVETEGQLAFLSRERCNEFQGYFFARPMRLEALVEELLQNQCRYLLPALEA